MNADFSVDQRGPSDGHVRTERAQLYYRTVGEGWPIIVLHGGPDFDHHYLLPEMDRLGDSFRLIYYDQRGRGRSTGALETDEVSIASEVEDLESVRRHFGLGSAAVLGHSWWNPGELYPRYRNGGSPCPLRTRRATARSLGILRSRRTSAVDNQAALT